MRIKMKRKSEVRKRRRKAISLKLKGYTQQQIAGELGISQSVVSDYLNKENTREKNIYRRLQLQRLDALTERAMSMAVETGSLTAVDRVLKLEERRTKLLGLDAPAS